MATQEQLDSFYQFATHKLASGESETPLDEIYDEWRLTHLPPDDEAKLLASLERGVADVDAGRTRPVEEVMEELRNKHGLPK